METPILEARSLRKTYDTGAVAGRGPSRRRSRPRPWRDGGDHGPSGCGKTTLLNCLSGSTRSTAVRRSSRGRHSPRCPIASERLPRTPHGLRLPVLQLDAGPDRSRERRAPAPGRASAGRRGARARARGARSRRSRRPRRPRARRAVGRRAPARHDRARRSSTTPPSSGPTSLRETSTPRTLPRSSRSCAD